MIKNKKHFNYKQEKNKDSQNIYEKKVYEVVKKCKISEKNFNTQQKKELAGFSNKIDIECNFIDEKDIGIEVKKYNTPDWMQCSIKYDGKNKKWKGVTRCKIPVKSREKFDQLINDINLYDGDIPPFMKNPITHKEWLEIKKETNKWNDKYIDIPSDTIKFKNCHYIQISDGYGLYYLGEDICDFNVPLFVVKQRLRVRTKIHARKNKKGFCNLSVTIACQPKNIKELIPSNYSLDDKNKLPINLIHEL